MVDTNELDCESEAVDCRFIIQSVHETEAIELADNHAKEGFGPTRSADELGGAPLQVV